MLLGRRLLQRHFSPAAAHTRILTRTSLTMSSDPTLSSLCARLPGDSAIIAALADGGSSMEKAHELMRKSRFVNGAVWSPVDPEPQPAPKLLAANAALAKEIGPPWSEMSDDALIQVVSGNTVLPGTRPWSLRYGGHQFG
jgi:hypothetical protein